MSLVFKNISHQYRHTQVLNDLSLAAKAGEITCLLGPSGGGKSTLLRLAAGLETIQTGCIELDGEELASATRHPPPEQRPIGLMFQENALFPHMTVARNIAFGLTGQSKPQQQQRVNSLLEMAGLPAFNERYPHELSGGEQQRIALLRSLAPQPRVILMDEPYASIDITLRRALREAARQTLKLAGATTILVTHDPAEAMEMADAIAVLDHGRILQTGAPQTIYEQPAAPSVAALFGDAQQLEAQSTTHGFSTAYGEIAAPDHARPGSDTGCRLVIRPDGLSLQKSDAANLKIIDLRYVGAGWIAFLLPQDALPSTRPLRVAVPRGGQFNLSDTVSLHAKSMGFFCFAG